MTKFEEGKTYKHGDELFTVTARGDIAVGFEDENGHLFSTKIRGTSDCECACYAGMTIWASELVNIAAEVDNELDEYLAKEKKRQDFVKRVVLIPDGKKIKLIPQKNLGGETFLTARKVDFNNFDYRQMSDGLYDIRICRDGHYYAFSTLAAYETEEEVLTVLRKLGSAISRGDETFTFPERRKSVIDWNAVGADIKLAELLHFQRAFKHAVKHGRIALAEDYFTFIKLLYKDYRKKIAA